MKRKRSSTSLNCEETLRFLSFIYFTPQKSTVEVLLKGEFPYKRFIILLLCSVSRTNGNTNSLSDSKIEGKHRRAIKPSLTLSYKLCFT